MPMTDAIGAPELHEFKSCCGRPDAVVRRNRTPDGLQFKGEFQMKKTRLLPLVVSSGLPTSSIRMNKEGNMTKRPGSLLRIILCMVIATSPLSAHDDWLPEDGDYCHKRARFMLITQGDHCHKTYPPGEEPDWYLEKIEETKRKREKEKETEKRNERMAWIVVGGWAVWYLVDRIKEEKEDNKRFTLSAYNSPNSPSFPSSYAVQGIKINFSLP